MNIHAISLGFAFAYLLEDETNFYLVDAGFRRQEKRILQVMEEKGNKPLKLIFITHAHVDHYGSAAALRRLTGCKVAVHRDDAGFLTRGESPLGELYGRAKLMKVMLKFMGPFQRPEAVTPDILLEDGEDLSPLGIPGRIIHTPGHTPGSSCLMLYDGRTFAGDMLSSDSGNHLQKFFIMDANALVESYRKMYTLPINHLYCGHGNQVVSAAEFHRLVEKQYGIHEA